MSITSQIMFSNVFQDLRWVILFLISTDKSECVCEIPLRLSFKVAYEEEYRFDCGCLMLFRKPTIISICKSSRHIPFRTFHSLHMKYFDLLLFSVEKNFRKENIQFSNRRFFFFLKLPMTRRLMRAHIAEPLVTWTIHMCGLHCG